MFEVMTGQYTKYVYKILKVETIKYNKWKILHSTMWCAYFSNKKNSKNREKLRIN